MWIDNRMSKPCIFESFCTSSERSCGAGGPFYSVNTTMGAAPYHFRPRLPPECCGFTPPPEDFFPMPPLTKLAPARPGDLPPPPPPGDLRSRSRASLRKNHVRSKVRLHGSKKSDLALRLAAKNAPDIWRAFSCCLRCCLVAFTPPFETGTGLPSVRSLSAC